MTTTLTPYQRRLFLFLSVATFFEGYDFMALAQILPQLRSDMGLSRAEGGLLVAFINAGTVLAYLLVRQADRWGRRRVLAWTIAGYTTFSFLSGLAPEIYTFAVCQLIARIFLTGEWAVAMVYAAEEFPAERRGMVIGVIQACASLGAIACSSFVPVLLKSPWGWRSVYFVGAIPLILVAIARRQLRETARFTEQLQKASTGPTPGFTAILRTPYRRRILQLALIWGLTYICIQNAVTFWKEFAMSERNWTDGQVGVSLSIAALAAMPLIFLAGKLLDQIGRKPGAVLIFTVAAFGVWGSYSFHDPWALTLALTLGIFGYSGVLPVLNAFNAELFPTHLRSDAFAWANNLLGRIGYVLSPLAVGFAADRVGWGAAVSATAIFPLLALVLIAVFLPETRGRELEETSAV